MEAVGGDDAFVNFDGFVVVIYLEASHGVVFVSGELLNVQSLVDDVHVAKKRAYSAESLGVFAAAVVGHHEWRISVDGNGS